MPNPSPTPQSRAMPRSKRRWSAEEKLALQLQASLIKAGKETFNGGATKLRPLLPGRSHNSIKWHLRVLVRGARYNDRRKRVPRESSEVDRKPPRSFSTQ